jgi:hypothetical protein
MNNRDDYLWDKSGKPDPEIQKLERHLSGFQHRRPTVVFPVIVPQERALFLPARLQPFSKLTLAAVAAFIVIVAILLMRGTKPFPVSGPAWSVSIVAGEPRIGSASLTRDRMGSLSIGQTLETDSQSRASLSAPDVGEIEIDPATRLRLLNMGANLQRVALDRGTIHARIWAPPGQFVVDTPSATTVDLGCAYTLQVDDSGAGLVRTSMGWVGFKFDGRESFIPAGAACATRPKVGPGTPYFEDASTRFRAALARWDFDDTATQQRDSDLSIVLAEARPSDGLTLWHLISRVDGAQRERVYDRLNALAPLPAGATKEDVLRLDQPMLDLWWNSLGFDDIAIWRQWERSWSATGPSSQN